MWFRIGFRVTPVASLTGFSSLSQAIIRVGAQRFLAELLLLGNVDLFFLIDMAEEEHQRAGAEDYRQYQRDPAIRVSTARVRVSHELVKFKNRATQRSQTYN
jgi:hypothetical protein